MATYLPIKKSGHRASGHRAAKRHNAPTRSKRTGKFLKGSGAHRTKPRHSVSRKRHLAGLKAARTRKRHAAAKSHRTPHRKNRARRANLPAGFHFTKLGKHSPRGRFHDGWPAVSKWTGPRRKSKGSKRRSNTGKIRYRTKSVIVHKTKRLRNPVGFDHEDGLKSLSTWGKVALGILFGLSGLAVAFGVPKGLAVVTGKDAFQRGWGGVGTAAVVSLGTSLLVGLVSKKAGLAVLVASGVGVVLLAINATSPKAAQLLIPINEATLAAMLPTFDPAPQAHSAVGNDYRPSRDASLSHVKGPADFWPSTPNTKTSSSGNEQGFYDSGYYASPLASKERF